MHVIIHSLVCLLLVFFSNSVKHVAPIETYTLSSRAKASHLYQNPTSNFEAKMLKVVHTIENTILFKSFNVLS